MAKKTKNQLAKNQKDQLVTQNQAVSIVEQMLSGIGQPTYLQSIQSVMKAIEVKIDPKRTEIEKDFAALMAVKIVENSEVPEIAAMVSKNLQLTKLLQGVENNIIKQ